MMIHNMKENYIIVILKLFYLFIKNILYYYSFISIPYWFNNSGNFGSKLSV